MKTLSETIDAMTAQGLRTHHEDRSRLNRMIAEGLRQHHAQYAEIEAMAEKALAEVIRREKRLEAMQKQFAVPDHPEPIEEKQAMGAAEHAWLGHFNSDDLCDAYDTLTALHDCQSNLEVALDISPAAQDFVDVSAGFAVDRALARVSDEIARRLSQPGTDNGSLSRRAVDRAMRNNDFPEAIKHLANCGD